MNYCPCWQSKVSLIHGCNVHVRSCPDEDYNTVVETSATNQELMLNFEGELKKLRDELY